MTKIVVYYDLGSASPMQVAEAAKGIGDLAFAVPPSSHNEDLIPLIAEYGDVIRLSDDWSDDLGVLREAKPDGILTFSERQVLRSNCAAIAIGLPANKVSAANRMVDKLEQRRCFSDRGLVNSVRFAPVDSVGDLAGCADYLGLPLILKPRTGEGSFGVAEVKTLEEGAELIRGTDQSAARYIAEELLIGDLDDSTIGDYVSVESIVCDDLVLHVGITGKFAMLRPFREVGNFVPAALTPSQRGRVESCVFEAIRAVGISWGLVHTEVKICSDDLPRVIEINGRMGGYHAELYREAFDIDLVRIAIRAALGERVNLDKGNISALAEIGRVTYSFSNLVPMGAQKLISVNGHREVRSLEGMRGYRVLLRPNSSLHGDGRTERLDFALGSCSGHAEMNLCLSAIRANLSFKIEQQGELIEVSGLDLARM